MRISILGVGSIGGLLLGSLGTTNHELVAVSRGLTAKRIIAVPRKLRRMASILYIGGALFGAQASAFAFRQVETPCWRGRSR